MTDETYTLADIPVDVAKFSGRVFAADVHTALPSHRRKRNEIALAIDGHGVSIYDTRQSKLLTSYAVSPQSSFTCPPCSLYLRNEARQSSRATYCSLRSPKPRITLFSEHCDGSSRTIARTVTSTIDLESHQAPVLHLDIINAYEEEHNALRKHLIVVYRDGLVECFSEHLDQKIWSSSASSTDTHQTKLAVLTNKRQAKKGLLKGREDVLSSLSGKSDEDDTPLLVLLSQTPTHAPRLSLQIYAIELSRPGKHALENTPYLQRIASFDLPQPAELDGEDSDFTLHISSGLVYQQVPKCIIIYELSGLLPQVVHKIAQQSAPFNSLLRLGTQTIAVSTGTSISTIGLKFCSLQAERQLNTKVHSGDEQNKNGADNNAHPSVRLLSYFDSIDLIVALRGTQLIALKSMNALYTAEESRKRKSGNRLVDAVGRGLSKRKLENHNASTEHQNTELLGSRFSLDEEDTWTDVRCALDEEFSHGRFQAFEEMIMSELTKGGQKPEFIAQYKLSYVFGKLFTITKEEPKDLNEATVQAALRINILPQELFGFLARNGLFTLQAINCALKQNGSLQPTERILSKSFVDALVTYDSTLSILRELFACRVAPSIQELVHVLAHIVRNWTRMQSSQTPKLLAIAETPHHSNMVDQHPSIALSASNDTLRLFHLVLERLSRYSQSTLTRTLQSHLPRPQLTSLVDILRISIARSGWLYNHDQNQVIPSSTPSPLSDPTSGTTLSTSLCPTIHLLSACLDSLNAAGWILGSGALTTDLTGTADTIAFMRAEISAALEGIEEAVYLNGLLEEILLCGRNHLPPASTEGQEGEQDQARTIAPQQSEWHGHQAPSIMPLGLSMGTESGLGAALPLGLKLEEKVSLTKVGAGGELIRRSRRDIGRLKSRQVGKYNFERIIV